MTIYELKDLTLENDLVAREKAGVDVRVILDQAEKSCNTGAYDVLTAGGVGVVWTTDVAAIVAVFNADYAHTSITPSSPGSRRLTRRHPSSSTTPRSASAEPPAGPAGSMSPMTGLCLVGVTAPHRALID